MTEHDKPRRRYDSSTRQAAASRRRAAVVASAHRQFGEHGWSGTTVRRIADDAGVSPKTVEALFGTKAALLRASVDLAIRGDADSTPMMQRASVRAIEEAPTAAEVVDLHAAHLRAIVPRSARIASVVEHAAASDDDVADLWRQMDANRRSGVVWAAGTLLAKPGRRRDLARREAESVFWVALDWSTFRTLSEQAGLDVDEYEVWLKRYYSATLLDRR